MSRPKGSARPASAGGVLYVDSQGSILHCSAGFARGLGYSGPREALDRQAEWLPLTWSRDLDVWLRGPGEPRMLFFRDADGIDVPASATVELDLAAEDAVSQADVAFELTTSFHSMGRAAQIDTGPVSSADDLMLRALRELVQESREAFLPIFLERALAVLGLERGIVAQLGPQGLEILASHPAPETDESARVLVGSLGELVMRSGSLVLQAGARERFPDDPLTESLGGGGLAASALFDAEEDVQGLLAFGSDGPLDDVGRAGELVKILALCASSELRLRATEAAALASTERYRRYFDQDLSGAYVSTPEGRLLACNPSFARIFGFESVDEAIRTPVIGLYSSERLRARYLDFLQEHGRLERVEARMLRKDGSALDVLVTAHAVRDDAGRLVEIFGSVLDLTENKRAQRRLEEQTELLDKTTDAIVQCSVSGEILFWNQGAEGVYGWSEDEILGESYLRLFEPSGASLFEEMQDRVLADGEWSDDVEQVTSDGSQVIVQLRATLIQDGEGLPRSVLFIGTDVTDKTRLEAQFLRAQRLESLGTLAGGIAHDLNNVLSPMMMSLKLLRQKLPGESDQALLSSLEASVRRGADLVRQVLWFARGVEGEQTLVRIPDLMREIQQICSDTFPKAIRIETDYPPDLPLVLGDSTQLYQVLMNLVLNSRDALAGGGTLRLVARAASIDSSYASMSRNASPGQYVLLEVDDDGCGIPPEDLERIFDPFFTTKGPGKGTGLGLTTAHSIVQSHGGFLEISSEPAGGTVVRVFLPQTTTEVEEIPSPAFVERGRVGVGRTVLVVDDEAAVQEVTRAALEVYGFDVLTARDGTEAISTYARDPDRIDAVVCDMAMPYLDGRATIRTLRRLNPDLAVVACSGLPEQQGEIDPGDGAPIGRLNKPFSAEELVAALTELLD